MSARKSSFDGIPKGILVAWVAMLYLLVALPCAGLYQQWRQYTVDFEIESVEQRPNDKGAREVYLVGSPAKPVGIRLHEVRWPEAKGRPIPEPRSVVNLRLQDAGPADLASRLMLWGGDRVYSVVHDASWSTRATFAGLSGTVLILLLILLRFVLNIAFGQLVYGEVAPRAGVYRFDKPLWAEGISVLLSAATTGAGIWSSVQLWRSGAGWMSITVDAVVTIPFVLRFGLMALFEAGNVFDYIEIGPDFVRVRDSGAPETFDRARIAGASIDERKTGFNDAIERHLTLHFDDGRERGYVLDAMNLAGFSTQLAALLPAAPEPEAAKAPEKEPKRAGKKRKARG